MAEAEFVEKWLAKANEDFGYAAASLDEEMEYFPQICWHFHQADDCKCLQKYYTEVRYPVVWQTKYNRDDALHAQSAARRIKDFVENILRNPVI